MMYFSMGRGWLFSRTAQRVYLLCTILDLALLGTNIGTRMAMDVAGVFTLPPMTRTALRLLLVPEAAGAAVLMVGMTYCWLAIGGSCGRKLVWFFYLSAFVITMPIYYFAVYRPFAAKLDSGISTVAGTAYSTSQP